LAQTDEDFQSILKIFEINQKIVLTEIKKLPYQIRTESRSRSAEPASCSSGLSSG
jgi:hypothetical protein